MSSRREYKQGGSLRRELKEGVQARRELEEGARGGSSRFQRLWPHRSVHIVLYSFTFHLVCNFNK